MPQLRQLVASLIPRGTGFDLMTVGMLFVVDKANLDIIFHLVLTFPSSVSFQEISNIFIHLSPGLSNLATDGLVKQR